MNYLYNFTGYLSKGDKQNLNAFSELVKEGLMKDRANFTKDNLNFVLEPTDVKEDVQESDLYKVYHYRGTFIYGFEKDGIFHVIPGDLSSQAERKQNESGEVVFYVNKETNKVDFISETFAGNSWGKKVEEMKEEEQKTFWQKYRYLLIVAIIVALIYIFSDASRMTSEVIKAIISLLSGS